MSSINKIKRGLIILCIILLVCLFAFIIIRNSNKTLSDEDIVEDIASYKTYTSYDGIFSIKTPITWNEVKEKYSLNENAVLELHNEQKNAYLVSVIINKEDVTDTFEQFQQDVFKQKETYYKVKIDNYNNVKVNGYNSKYVEFYNTNADKINTYIRAYAIETENYYVQIVMWTLKSNEENVSKEFDNIISNFKEIKLS